MPSPLAAAVLAAAAAAAIHLQLAAAGPVTTAPITETVRPEVVELSDEDDVQFHLYTRAHPRSYLRLEAGGTDFDPRRPTVLMAHGYLGSGAADSVLTVRDAVLAAADVHFVAVHWARLADGDYREAAGNTTVVAGRVAALLDALGARERDLHLAGFSLGAQLVAQVAAARAGGRVARITALDPARPLFDTAPLERRLDPSDADLVVVLHTAGGIAAFSEPLGHLDFYPNGGVSPQPACTHDGFPLVCSHMMAPSYLAEAIRRPGALLGRRCGSWDEFSSGQCEGNDTAALGLFQNYSTRGSFYLRTNDRAPFGLWAAGALPAPEPDLDNALEAGGAAARREGRMRGPDDPLAPAGGSSGAPLLLLPSLPLLLAAAGVAMATT